MAPLDPDDEPSFPALPNPRTLLRLYGVRPRKGLGQHFLVDAGHLAQIVAAAEMRPTDTVLEIGPGLGVLTAVLVRQAGRVIAVELDPAMHKVLRSVLGQRANLELVAADILTVEPADLLGVAPDARGRLEGYKVVANLPYYITSAALRHLLEARVRPELAVVMVQKEVADRILAQPGDLSVLGVAVQFYARPSRVCVVPAAAFYPSPTVDSAVLRLDVYATPPVDVPSDTAFFRVVRAGFGQKRKQLKNSLAAGLGISTEAAVATLHEAGIEPSRRAETLSLAEWAALTVAAVRYASA